jgi:hypothetical protein
MLLSIVLFSVSFELPYAFSVANNIDLLNFKSGPTSGYKIIGPSGGAEVEDFNKDGLNDMVLSAHRATIAGGLTVRSPT